MTRPTHSANQLLTTTPEKVVREIHGWHTECGACGHGRGGWADSPALKGEPIVRSDSPSCPKCGRTFTHERDNTREIQPRPIEEAEAA